MYGLVKLLDISNKTLIIDKIQNFEVVGVYNNIIEIEKLHLNYFAHKYRLKDNFWCYFSKKPKEWNANIEPSQLADMIIIDLDFDKEQLQFQFKYSKILYDELDKEMIKIIREIKLSMIL